MLNPEARRCRREIALAALRALVPSPLLANLEEVSLLGEVRNGRFQLWRWLELFDARARPLERFVVTTRHLDISVTRSGEGQLGLEAMGHGSEAHVWFSMLSEVLDEMPRDRAVSLALSSDPLEPRILERLHSHLAERYPDISIALGL